MLTVTTSLKLVTMGFCLGIGFWMSKKLTNKADELLAEYDKKLHKKLNNELNEILT